MLSFSRSKQLPSSLEYILAIGISGKMPHSHGWVVQWPSSEKEVSASVCQSDVSAKTAWKKAEKKENETAPSFFTHKRSRTDRVCVCVCVSVCARVWLCVPSVSEWQLSTLSNKKRKEKEAFSYSIFQLKEPKRNNLLSLRLALKKSDLGSSFLVAKYIHHPRVCVCVFLPTLLLWNVPCAVRRVWSKCKLWCSKERVGSRQRHLLLSRKGYWLIKKGKEGGAKGGFVFFHSYFYQPKNAAHGREKLARAPPDCAQNEGKGLGGTGN